MCKRGVVKSKLVKILSKSEIVCLCYYHVFTGKSFSMYLLQPMSLILITMVKAPVAQCQIETWTSNKTTHPRQAVKPRTHHTTAEVQKEHDAKAEAKAACEEAKQQSFRCMLELQIIIK